MASVTSLGIHKPSALQYLIAESVLPADITDDQYDWQTADGSEGQEDILEEVVTTQHCVVWSRGSIIQRVLRFEVENEAVVQAVLTWFPTETSRDAPGRLGKTYNHRATAIPTLAKGHDGHEIALGSLSSVEAHARGSPPISEAGKDLHHGEHTSERPSHRQHRTRALVVVLKTQVHVYLLSGISHVLNLPFEVDLVLPAPQGLLLQRKLSDQLLPAAPPTTYSVPPNSFVSSQPQQWTPQSSHTTLQPSKYGLLPIPAIQPDSRPAAAASGSQKADTKMKLPRFFSLTDTMSEMGLVVVIPSISSNRVSEGARHRNQHLDPLGLAEALIYVSKGDEIVVSEYSSKPADSYLLTVTSNEQTGVYTVSSLIYSEPQAISRTARIGSLSMSDPLPRRRSSFGMAGTGTGATTPIGRGPASTRESFAARNRNHNVLGTSNVNISITSTGDDANLDASIEMTSNLDPEFENPGLPAKSSRRVSSLLAREDLSMGQDKLAFTDRVAGHPSVAGLHSSSNRRGESFGGYSSRASFGDTRSRSRRSSVPPNSFHVNVNNGNGSSHERSGDDIMDGVNEDSDLDDFDELRGRATFGGLRKEIILTNVGTFPMRSADIPKPTQPSNQPLETKVFTILPPRTPTLDGSAGVSVYICIVNKRDRQLLVLNAQVKHRGQPRWSRKAKSGKPIATSEPSGTMIGRVTEVRRGNDVLDACRLSQGSIQRMLVLSEASSGHVDITLQAPWSTLVKVELPSRLAIYHPFNLGPAVPPSRRREGGLKRILSEGPQRLVRLQHESAGAQVDVVDDEGTRHRIQVQLEPQDFQIAKILRLCQFLLPTREHGGDGILVGWWTVLNWLHTTVDVMVEHEWTALVVLLFAMAVGFINGGQAEIPHKPKRRKTGLFRSSSGANIDLEQWDSMLEQEGGSGSAGPRWSKSAAWDWTTQLADQSSASTQKISGLTRWTRSTTAEIPSTINMARNNPFVTQCASWARQFLKSPAGRLASGELGYLPTATSKSPEVRRTALATILIGLHLLEEEAKLDIACSGIPRKGISRLTPVLAQLGCWLGWHDWSWKENAYYSVEDVEMEKWSFENAAIPKDMVPAQPFGPPSVFSFIGACLRQDPNPTFLSLLDLVNPAQSSEYESGPLAEQAAYQLMKVLTPRTVLFTKLVSRVLDVNRTPNERVQDMTNCGMDVSLLESLPEGLAASLWEAIVHCQEDPPVNWGVQALQLVGRDDLSMLLSTIKYPSETLTPRMILSHEATRDVHNIGIATLETDTINAFDGSAEVDRLSLSRLIFHEDRRFMEASKLLHPMKPAVARCDPEPDWSEADLLEAQKDLVQTVAIRTLAIPPGRGLLYYSARVPLLTEKFPIHGFALSCVMKPSNNTVTADRNAFTEEKVCWAFFHAGVSAGLSISRHAKGIDTSWIQFNKPVELNNRHAGFLLALGLNGHLKSIAKWVAFKYLTPKHTMTSIGLLLGLSASYLGTMDTLVTRLLSVHVTRMLPPGAAELNLSPLTQTTGIMGIGLLYCGTQHRRMSEVMLSEIEHIDQEDPSTPLETLRDEGYRLAAGFALGYINLGKGRDLKGLHDMSIIERLLSLAVGTKKVNIVHILDKATAGATIATALIFMKTQNEALARKIDIPDTVHQFGYVRPDIFLLRTLARHLIMWDDIRTTSDWIQSVLPPIYRHRVSMTSIRTLYSEDLPFYNIMAGICFAIGLRFAGSGSLEVRNLLVHYLDQFMRICNMATYNYDSKLTRTTVRNCQDLLALSAACVMAGSGDLLIFRRLRALHGRVSAETPYGSHLAAHTAIGVLFLGGGSFTFGTSDIAVASLLCAFYPLFPTSVLDNKAHLQAFRHFWVLAAEARCLVARDVDTHRPVSMPALVTLQDGTERAVTAPCLLPELKDVAKLRTNSMAYWQVTLDFANNPSHLSTFQRDQTIYVRKRAAHDAHSSVFSATLQALNDSQNSNVSRQIFEYIFDLPVFTGLDKAQQALVIPPDAGSVAHAGTKGTMVDDRLVLEKACLGTGNRDRLWNLRLLLNWAEGVRQKDGRLRWLGNEVVEGLKAAIWVASSDEI